MPPRPMWKMPGIVARERRYRGGRNRIPEPMVMNEPESVTQFHAAGGASPGMQAVYDFSSRALSALLPQGARLLDLGVGSGRALAGAVRLRPDLEVTGVDLAPNMLATARELFESQGIADRIRLVEADITALPSDITDQRWDGISCVWTLHQLPDRDVLQGAARQISALRKHSGAAIWIFDFQRLHNPATFPALYDVLEPQTYPVVRHDAIASEAAAFTQQELVDELRSADLPELNTGVSRPLAWSQALWAPRSDGAVGSAGVRPERLPRRARLDAALLRSGFTAKPF